MLEEAEGPGRRFRLAPLERPYGRGVNFQITVADAAALHERVLAAGSSRSCQSKSAGIVSIAAR